jgi:ketosteroid isomerase-like protein
VRTNNFGEAWLRILWVSALIVVVSTVNSGDARSEEVVEDVEQAATQFVRAFNNLDWERFRTSFAEDATVFFPFPDTPRRADGVSQFEPRFRAFFDQSLAAREGPPYLDIDPHDLAIQVYGTIAVVTFHLRAEPELNRRTVVFEKRAGQWLIVHLHASVMVDPNG